MDAQLISAEIKSLNRTEFDRVTNLLQGMGLVLGKIRTELQTIRNKFVSMREIIIAYPDQITLLERQLYDTQIQALLHAIFMYLGFRDSQGIQFIKPITQGQTNPVALTLRLPNYTIVKNIVTIDNMTVDIYNWDIYVGDITFSALRSSEIASQFSSMTSEIPDPYFSKEEFLTGINYEIEKLLLWCSQINRSEQQVNSGLRYISELKNIGLYM